MTLLFTYPLYSTDNLFFSVKNGEIAEYTPLWCRTISNFNNGLLSESISTYFSFEEGETGLWIIAPEGDFQEIRAGDNGTFYRLQRLDGIVNGVNESIWSIAQYIFVFPILTGNVWPPKYVFPTDGTMDDPLPDQTDHDKLFQDSCSLSVIDGEKLKEFLTGTGIEINQKAGLKINEFSNRKKLILCRITPKPVQYGQMPNVKTAVLRFGWLCYEISSRAEFQGIQPTCSTTNRTHLLEGIYMSGSKRSERAGYGRDPASGKFFTGLYESWSGLSKINGYLPHYCLFLARNTWIALPFGIFLAFLTIIASSALSTWVTTGKLKGFAACSLAAAFTLPALIACVFWKKGINPMFMSKTDGEGKRWNLTFYLIVILLCICSGWAAYITENHIACTEDLMFFWCNFFFSFSIGLMLSLIAFKKLHWLIKFTASYSTTFKIQPWLLIVPAAFFIAVATREILFMFTPFLLGLLLPKLVFRLGFITSFIWFYLMFSLITSFFMQLPVWYL
ncbi:MAG: hypothetical protein PHW04_17530 [Candidatus Wallbacteria bacterium]|nr:hypothetical protein [Candidatus Wallbacteria bacterium]